MDKQVDPWLREKNRVAYPVSKYPKNQYEKLDKHNKRSALKKKIVERLTNLKY